MRGYDIEITPLNFNFYTPFINAIELLFSQLDIFVYKFVFTSLDQIDQIIRHSNLIISASIPQKSVFKAVAESNTSFGYIDWRIEVHVDEF